MPGRRQQIPRREFVKSAVAIGGAAALAACLDRNGVPDIPRGPEDLSTLPERQHAWNAYLSTDEHGNVVAPRHHVVRLLEYDDSGAPSDADREVLETALRTLESAYERGNDGLVFTIGYAPRYFERFDADLPESVDLPEPRALSDFEDPAFDRPDAVLHLASDHGSVPLAVEAGMFGEAQRLNGVPVERRLNEVFTATGRRTGFVGEGLPADHQDVDGIPGEDPVPEDAPLYMGFKSGFSKNQASEDRVTIPDGPFAGGTTQHLSRLRLRLKDWYDEQDHEARVAEMFCPAHAAAGTVEGTGENLGDDTGMTGECVEDIEDHAMEYGRVGHSQKMARIREDDAPIILRRDFDSTDGGEAGLHFLAHQRAISDFEDTREAMNGAELTENPAIRERVNNGILEYTFVKRRGNYLLPPRSKRAFPTPRP